ncbi:MAG: AraC family transcriptional regulator [Clostridia bacterium]|nr:AraC family transcriptional regulator [Clostridia bacterium]
MSRSITHNNIYIRDRHFTDLNPVVLGWEHCLPGHTFGPAIRDHYLLHYVVSGSGQFKTIRGQYGLTSGQIFLIRPGEITTYNASEDDPWYYIWIGFNGKLAPALDSLPDILTPRDCNIIPAMLRCERLDRMREEYLAGQLFLLLADLLGETAAAHPDIGGYTERAANYIEKNYMRPLPVEKLADDMNINRRYLSRIFKRDYGVTLKEYITAVKMKHARNFLTAGYSVGQAAAMAGYADVFNFSKMFKKFYGVSPTDMQKGMPSDSGTAIPGGTAVPVK